MSIGLSVAIEKAMPASPAVRQSINSQLRTMTRLARMTVILNPLESIAATMAN